MKIWFDKNDILNDSFIGEQVLIMPFLEESFIKADKNFKRSCEWINIAKKYISFSNIEDCDVIVYPMKMDDNISKYIPLAKKYNKKIITLYNDDNTKPIAVGDPVICFRTSINKSDRKFNEFGFPAFSQDFRDYGDIVYRTKKTKPVIGFCGYIDHPDSIVRRNAILNIKKNNDISTNFNIRDHFWGGSIHNPILRNEFYKNIVSSDFILCARGSGNFSFRLYETLSCGRIPLFINTDCVLPFDEIIDWKKYVIWVDEKEMSGDSIIKAVMDFWENISPEQYIDRQRQCRQLYENYMSPGGFIKTLSDNLNTWIQ